MAGFLYRHAQLKGLLGGSRPWTILWVALLARRLLRRFAGDKPEIVYSERLERGQSLVISAVDREPKVIAP